MRYVLLFRPPGGRPRTRLLIDDAPAGLSGQALRAGLQAAIGARSLGDAALRLAVTTWLHDPYSAVAASHEWQDPAPPGTPTVSWEQIACDGAQGWPAIAAHAAQRTIDDGGTCDSPAAARPACDAALPAAARARLCRAWSMNYWPESALPSRNERFPAPTTAVPGDLGDCPFAACGFAACGGGRLPASLHRLAGIHVCFHRGGRAGRRRDRAAACPVPGAALPRPVCPSGHARRAVPAVVARPVRPRRDRRLPRGAACWPATRPPRPPGRNGRSAAASGRSPGTGSSTVPGPAGRTCPPPPSPLRPLPAGSAHWKISRPS